MLQQHMIWLTQQRRHDSELCTDARLTIDRHHNHHCQPTTNTDSQLPHYCMLLWVRACQVGCLRHIFHTYHEDEVATPALESKAWEMRLLDLNDHNAVMRGKRSELIAICTLPHVAMGTYSVHTVYSGTQWGLSAHNWLLALGALLLTAAPTGLGAELPLPKVRRSGTSSLHVSSI